MFQIRATGALIEDGEILIVRQRVDQNRAWSLPGGRAEAGETLEGALLREIKEETGLTTKLEKLLYICDKPGVSPPILHITFLLSRSEGDITLPSNEYDSNPITDVKFVKIAELGSYGFSRKFIDLAQSGFLGSGSYMGDKKNIGL